MTWKPTEGVQLARTVVMDLERDATACGAWLDTNLVFRARMLEVIGKALDQALTDGAEKEALDRVVGNGHAETGLAWVAPLRGHAETGLAGAFGPVSYTDYSLPLATADPAGFEPLPPLPPLVFSDGTVATVSIPEAPKKRRGRPKGAKAKAKAKRKSAKAIKAELYPTDPVDAAPAEVIAESAP